MNWATAPPLRRAACGVALERRSWQIAVFWTQDFRAQMMVRFLQGLRCEMERLTRPIRLVVYPYNNDALKDMKALTSACDCHAALICNASYADLSFLEEQHA